MADTMTVANITCSRCAHRHPAAWSCDRAAQLGRLGRTDSQSARDAGIVGYIAVTEHGTLFKSELSDEDRAARFGGWPVWRAVRYA